MRSERIINEHTRGIDARRKPTPTDSIHSKNASGRPMEPVNVNYPLDPVHNVAMQNPVAQPGGGFYPIMPSDKIATQFFGVMSREPLPAPTVYNQTRKLNPPLTRVTEVSAQQAEEKYFNSGTRAQGSSTYIHPTNMNDGFFLKQENHKKIKRNTRKENEINVMEEGASVAWPFTSLCPANYPVGSKSSKDQLWNHTPTRADTSTQMPGTVVYENAKHNFSPL